MRAAIARVRASWAGLLTAAIVALAAAFVADHYGGPVLLYALFFGMAFNFLAVDPRVKPGIDLAARQVLRFGVALLGARITLGQIVDLGADAVVLVVVGVAATIGAGIVLSRLAGRPRVEGVLTGGAVAICGASAALAIAAVLPRTPQAQRMTLFTVVGVTALSTLAMILYPAIVKATGLAGVPAGIFLGGTIHDVAQVVAAGYIVSPVAGDTATVIKLLRVLMLVPAVAAIGWFHRSAGQGSPGTHRPPLLPWFLVAFVLLVIANSVGLVPAEAGSLLSSTSRAALVLAIAALGVKTSFKELADLGWRPVAMMVAETAFLAVWIFVGVHLLR